MITVPVTINMTKAERALLARAANLEDRSLSSFGKLAILAEVGKVLKEKEKSA